MKKLLINLVLICFSLLISLGLGELVARTYLSYQDRMLREKSRENILTQVAKSELFTPIYPGSFGNRPDASVHWWGLDIRTDSLGCRKGAAAPDSASVILFLGDSMIFGLGLPDSSTIPSLLQKELNRARPDQPVRVVNSAVIGYDFQQYLYQLHRLAPILKPSMVLVGICYNDLFPNEDPFGTIARDRGAVTKVREVEADRPPSTHSYSRSGIKGLLKDAALYELYQQSNLGAKLFKKPTHYSEPEVLASLQAAPSLTDEFVSTVEGLEIPCAYVYFPTPEELGRESQSAFVRLLKERNQSLLDLGVAADLDKDDYFLREKDGRMQPDIHFNLKGSKAVAEEINLWLTRQKLLY